MAMTASANETPQEPGTERAESEGSEPTSFREVIAASTQAQAQAVRTPQEQCDYLHGAVDGHLERLKASKTDALDPCEDQSSGCGCSGSHGAGEPKVDLVVLIDTSGSMSTQAAAVSSAAAAAIEAAQAECPTDLRIEWLGVGGTFSAPTNFSQSYLSYLAGVAPPGSVFAGSGHNEEGADATADISRYFDWREDACRAIFYMSDEPLENGFAQDAADDAATSNAIAEATANQVTVFTHLVGGTGASNNPATRQNFSDLATATGGRAELGGRGDLTQYLSLLKDVICNACGGCKEVAWPDVQPCISISCGDGSCDSLETDDLEMLMISVCNCYSNVTFTDFEIAYLWVTLADGSQVPLLPDGTRSVEALPLGPICFGDIAPCIDGEVSCVTRQFVLSARGAQATDYKITLGGVCYGMTNQVLDEACFEFELCAS